VYITANISGGHLNPAVTLATIFTGHISIVKGIAYIFMQITGACFGILMVVSLNAELWPHHTFAFARFDADICICKMQCSSSSSSSSSLQVSNHAVVDLH